MNEYNGNKDFKINIPTSVATIITVLEKNGYEAFAVGGCVRDTILGREPEDWDITTSAPPMQVKALFHRTLDTGLQHGTVTVMIGGIGYEVTTYRIDGEYSDSRHPESVEFTSNLIEDLKRRDFTINAMAYNPTVGLVDAFCGIEDIHNKLIKCVGNAEERFSEDALRILRALRFAAQLGFEIDSETMEAVKKLSPTLQNISAERIQTELEKLIVSNNPGELITAYHAGITKVILPEFDAMMECPQVTPYHQYNVGEHTIKVVENVPANRLMRWTALLHDVAKPNVVTLDKRIKDKTHFYGHAEAGSEMAVKIMRRLKMDNKTIKLASRLIACHDDRPAESGCTPEIVRRSVHKIGKDIYPEYLQLAAADFKGKSDYGKSVGYEDYLYVCKEFDYIIEHNICTHTKELKITGKDLIAAGCPTGPIIGDILEQLLEEVLQGPDLNNEQYLKTRGTELIRKNNK